MAAVVAVAQMIEQLGQGVKMAVDVADDVEFACRQGVGKHGMGKRKGFSGCRIARKNSLSGCLKGCAAGLGAVCIGCCQKAVLATLQRKSRRNTKCKQPLTQLGFFQIHRYAFADAGRHFAAERGFGQQFFFGGIGHKGQFDQN